MTDPASARTPGRGQAMPPRAHRAGARRWSCAARPGPARAFHTTLPDYRPTPLVGLPGLAAQLGVAQLWLKDEADRFGLPAFKILGASWAVNRALSTRAGLARNRPARWTSCGPGWPVRRSRWSPRPTATTGGPWLGWAACSGCGAGPSCRTGWVRARSTPSPPREPSWSGRRWSTTTSCSWRRVRSRSARRRPGAGHVVARLHADPPLDRRRLLHTLPRDRRPDRRPGRSRAPFPPGWDHCSRRQWSTTGPACDRTDPPYSRSSRRAPPASPRRSPPGVRSPSTRRPPRRWPV